MLLDLYVAVESDALISVTILAHAADVPQTTAFRWMRRLEEAGPVERSDDESDRRRRHVALTPKGIEAMRGYLREVT